MGKLQSTGRRIGVAVIALAIAAGAILALVGLGEPGGLPSGEAWGWLLGASLLIWAAYLPLEFVLVAIVCALFGGAFGGAWRAAFVDDSSNSDAALVWARVPGLLAASIWLTVDVEAYRRAWSGGRRRIVRTGALLSIVGLMLATRLLPEPLPWVATWAQLAAVLLFAPLGAAILLFKQGARGLPNLKQLLGGLWIFGYLGGAQVVLFGLVTPFALLFTRKRWALVRRRCADGMRFMFDSFPYGRMEREGVEASDFERPAVIVSNHQSSVDIPLILSLPTDVRLLVSRRVWRTPVLGIGARLLGHLPVEAGDPQQTFERCGGPFEAGASVHAFPEGTRSEGAYPRRFRRGAFDIAVEFGADLLPLLLVNSRSCVPRDGFWVGDFRMKVKALPRVTPESFDYSAGANALMKHVQGLVRAGLEAEHWDLHDDESFLRRQVAERYRYLGRRLRLRVKQSLRLRGETREVRSFARGADRLLILDEGLGVSAQLAMMPSPRVEACLWLCDSRERVGVERSVASQPGIRVATSLRQIGEPSEFDRVLVGRGAHLDGLEEFLTRLGTRTSVWLERADDEQVACLNAIGFLAIEDGSYRRSASAELPRA